MSRARAGTAAPLAAALAATLGVAAAGCGNDGGDAPRLSLATTPVKYMGMPAAIVPGGAGGLLMDGEGVRTLEGTAIGEVTDATARTWVSVTPFSTGAGVFAALGADSDGHVWRMTRDGTEDASGRYALGGRKVTRLAAMQAGWFAAAADGGVLVARGTDVVEYKTGTVDAIGGGGTVVVWREGGVVTRIDAQAGESRQAKVGSAGDVAVGSDGDVYVASGRTLFRWHGDDIGAVHTFPSDIEQMRGFGGRVWFASGRRIGSVDKGAVTLSQDLAPKGEVAVWPRIEGDGGWFARDGEIVRFVLGAGSSADLWAANIQPIFAAHCAGCHTRNERDLSRYEGWDKRRALVRTKVIEKKEMPPKDEPPLSDAERATIEAWLNVL